MFLLIFGSLPTLAFQLIQMHCRLPAPEFSRDRDSNKLRGSLAHSVLTCLAQGETEHSHSPTESAQAPSPGILASISAASEAEVRVSQVQLQLSLQYPIGNTTKFSSILQRNTHSCLHHRSLRGLLITNQRVHPRATVRRALGSAAAHFWQHISTHPCLKDTIKHSVSVTSKGEGSKTFMKTFPRVECSVGSIFFSLVFYTYKSSSSPLGMYSLSLGLSLCYQARHTVAAAKMAHNLKLQTQNSGDNQTWWHTVCSF